jgi:hypothetical protein
MAVWQGFKPLPHSESRLKLTEDHHSQERARSPFHKELIFCGMGFKNGLEARSTKDEFSCGTGKMPVYKGLINNDARSQLKLTSCTILS